MPFSSEFWGNTHSNIKPHLGWIKIHFLAAFPLGSFSQLYSKAAAPGYTPYRLSFCTPGALSPWWRPPVCILTMGKTRMGFLGSETQEKKEAAADETPGCQLSDRVAGIALPMLPRKSPQSLSAPLFSPPLPHLMCVFWGVWSILLNKAALHGSFWPNITAAIANTIWSVPRAKHRPGCLINNNSFILYNNPMK